MKAISILIVSAVPAVLGLGGLYWLTFGERLHVDVHHSHQEDRAALAVKAEPLPVAKIDVRISARQSASFKIDQVDQDGSSLTLYARNVSHRCISYVEAHYLVLAPDDTVIANDATYQTDETSGLQPNQRYEFKFTAVPVDDRIKRIEVWVSGEPSLECK